MESGMGGRGAGREVERVGVKGVGRGLKGGRERGSEAEGRIEAKAGGGGGIRKKREGRVSETGKGIGPGKATFERDGGRVGCRRKGRPGCLARRARRRPPPFS